MIRLELPWPPSSNNAYSVVRGRKILSAAGRAYHAAVATLILLAGSPKMDATNGGRLAATLELYPPDNRRRDVMNCEKLVTDSVVKAGVIPDDCLIDRYTVIRRCVNKGGRVVLTIEPYEGDE